MPVPRLLLSLPVSAEKTNTPLDKKAGWKIIFQNTKSGAGLQFLLLDRTAKASAKGVFLFIDTGITATVNITLMITFSITVNVLMTMTMTIAMTMTMAMARGYNCYYHHLPSNYRS